MHASLSSLHRALAVPRHSFISSLHVAVSYDECGARRERVTVDIDVFPSLTPRRLLLPSPTPPPPLATVRSPSSPYTIRTLSPITPLHGPAVLPSSIKEPPSTSTLTQASPIGDVDMATPSSLPTRSSTPSPPPPSSLTPAATLLPSPLRPSPSTPSVHSSSVVSPVVSTPVPVTSSKVDPSTPPPSLPLPSHSGSSTGYPPSAPLHPSCTVHSGSAVGMKRSLTPSDEEGEEKKDESEGSTSDGPMAMCPPQGQTSKKDKLREKRRKRKERKKAETAQDEWEEIYPTSVDHYYSAFLQRYGQ